MKIGFISLGCAKNQVNSEQMLWLLRQGGYELSTEIEDTDAVVINTCGFIESAKSEAIEYIIELGRLKAEGKIGKLLVAGCLAQRYGEEILGELPEVDGLVGCGSFDEIVSAVGAALSGQTPKLFGSLDGPVSETDRIITTSGFWAYLRIAEGCDNRCAYCVIPEIRGGYRSRPFEKVVGEARRLAALGMKELIVVAQDITRYGRDLYGRRRLAELLEELCRIDGLEWIRLHYLYPDELDDDLIGTIAREEKILKYLDIPIQHINDDILKRMNRRGTGGEIRELFRRLRERIPGLVLRTSIIAGFPGEGEAEFEELCGFLRQAQLERAGIFAFSPEEGTPAAEMPDQVDEDVKGRRVELLRDIQSRVMDEYNARQLGQTLRVLCEGYDRLAGCWFGRSFADSPEIDGKVFFTAEPGSVREGEFYEALIIEELDGDLIGEVTANDDCE